MHRVELKAIKLDEGTSVIHNLVQFLMYRVELKVLSLNQKIIDVESVPNVPCGVESISNIYKVSSAYG